MDANNSLNPLKVPTCFHTATISAIGNKSLTDTLGTDNVPCSECGVNLKLSFTLIFDIYDGLHIFDVPTSVEKDKEIMDMMYQYATQTNAKG